MEVSWNRDTPESSIWDWDFPWKKPSRSIQGYPHFQSWGQPFMDIDMFMVFIIYISKKKQESLIDSLIQGGAP